VYTCTPRSPREATNHYGLYDQKISYARVEQIKWQIRFHPLAEIPVGIYNRSYGGSCVIDDSKRAKPKSKFVLANYIKEARKSNKNVGHLEK